MTGTKIFNRGDRVRFTLYGEEHHGRVIRQSRDIVWIEDDNGGPLFRERWMHAESLEVEAILTKDKP